MFPQKKIVESWKITTIELLTLLLALDVFLAPTTSIEESLSESFMAFATDFDADLFGAFVVFLGATASDSDDSLSESFDFFVFDVVFFGALVVFLAVITSDTEESLSESLERLAFGFAAALVVFPFAGAFFFSAVCFTSSDPSSSSESNTAALTVGLLCQKYRDVSIR